LLIDFTSQHATVILVPIAILIISLLFLSQWNRQKHLSLST
jgi:hypothetical protein